MYLGPFHRAGSLSVADPDVEQPSTSGHPVDNRVDSLISRIRPARHSELRRHRVAQHVSDLVARCFSSDHEVEAFMFGSVPLKTYLPDGDIDLSVFQAKGSSLRETWATRLCSVLESEQHNPGAVFTVKDVQVIHAEVKLLKCLVDNIVVDISFETLGGLCTVAFLEAIDRHIGDQHLFKRSVILIKAWCYYESRLLGAPHGLLSTYALETMVLYIFNVYHNNLHTPCQVLHRFLDVFSHFDWDKYCLSLQGPMPLSGFPHPSVEMQPQDKDELLLSSDTIDEMLSLYSPTLLQTDSQANLPAGNRNFSVKFLNIMDPLLPTNNLGRSVSKASFARIRKALKHGAQTLTDIMLKDDSQALTAVDSFFKNTWNAQRPMAQSSPQNTQQQLLHSWQGSKSKPAYGMQGISPQQLQYLQQYQHTYMLQHLHQQQQLQQQHHLHHLHQAPRSQHQLPPYFDPYQADMHSDAGFNRSQPLLQKQQQHRQRTSAATGQRPHTEPPTRVASPFAADSVTHPFHSQLPAEQLRAPVPGQPLPDNSAESPHAMQSHYPGHDAHPLGVHGVQSQEPATAYASQAQKPTEQQRQAPSPSGALPQRPPAEDVHKHGIIAAPAVQSADAAIAVGTGGPLTQAATKQPQQQSAAEDALGSDSEPQHSLPRPKPQICPPSQSQTQTQGLPAQARPIWQSSHLDPPLQTQPQSLPVQQTQVPAASSSLSQSYPPAHTQPQLQLPAQPPSRAQQAAADQAAGSHASAGPQSAAPSPSHPSAAPHGSPSMPYPLQALTSPTHLHPSQGDLYQYGMMQMLHPGALMLPPQQHQQQHHQQQQPAQQHSKGGRGSRPSAPMTHNAGGSDGKWSPNGQQPQHQQPAVLEQLFPDLRPPTVAPPQHQEAPQTQPMSDTASLSQPNDDVLAGNLDQLKQHLQIARVCQSQRTAAIQSNGQSKQQTPSQAAGLPNGTGPAPAQAVRQQRKPEPSASRLLHERPRPQAGFDRWLNDPQPQLNRSISPPVPLDHHAEPPLRPPSFHGPFFLHTNIGDSRDLGYQQGQSQVQQPSFRRPLPPSQQQQHRSGPWPRHQPPPLRASSADNLQRHAVSADATSEAQAVELSTSSQLSQPGPVQQSDPSHRPDELRSNSPSGWMQEQDAFPGLPATPLQGQSGNAPGASPSAHASVTSPPALQGIWGNGLHQQRLVNLANDLPAVKVTPPSTTAADPAATGTVSGFPGRERAPTSARSAGSTPQAREGPPAGRGYGSFDSREEGTQGRGHPSFDGPPHLQKRRQRMPYNASAQELGQSNSSADGAVKRDRAPKLSLDSLTSQRQAEAAQRQQALANFDLKTEDFPALGGLPASTSLSAMPLPVKNRATPGKAWSEADASVTTSPPPASSSAQK